MALRRFVFPASFPAPAGHDGRHDGLGFDEELRFHIEQAGWRKKVVQRRPPHTRRRSPANPPGGRPDRLAQINIQRRIAAGLSSRGQQSCLDWKTHGGQDIPVRIAGSLL